MDTEIWIVAFFMQVSVGTLLAFTMVAISVLILRYVPPDEVPLPSSLQESIDFVSLRYSSSAQDIDGGNRKDHGGTSKESTQPLLDKGEAPVGCPLIVKQAAQGGYNRRKVAGWTIMLTCVRVLLLTSAALKVGLPSFVQFMLCGIGGTLLLSGLVVLTCIDQDDARHSFGHTGGFICPFVPLLPIACILINIYLLVNVGAATWTRVLIWLGLGAIVYVFYGRTHSSLIDAVYVPAAHVDEIYCSSTNSLA
uniref:Putative Cationic amino acid transporter 2 isoform 1 n=1 Tax=Davidia involucrata TaxID=16924 RepID=A0A5B7C0N2_DAVIN